MKKQDFFSVNAGALNFNIHIEIHKHSSVYTCYVNKSLVFGQHLYFWGHNSPAYFCSGVFTRSVIKGAKPHSGSLATPLPDLIPFYFFSGAVFKRNGTRI